MKRKFIKYTVLAVISGFVYWGCSKGPDPTPGTGGGSGGGSTGGGTGGGTTTKTCIISGIGQYNSGSKAELALTITYNSSLAPTRLLVFDSVSNAKMFDASLTYATADSIRIDQNQYIKLDANKRVSAFRTLSDLTDVANAEVYLYLYTYDGSGYLIGKKLYVNGSATASYVTTYTYTSNLLTKCVMTVAGNDNMKVLESTLTYDNNTSTTNWIYLFPDGFETIYYSTALNFGTKPAKAISQAITKLYNPVNASVLDTWTTNYSGYTSSNGYISAGTAAGDLQQGMPSFYGKTSFYYQCQ